MEETIANSDITLYFLQASRSIRVAWLLEELSLPYKSIYFDRENNKAPAEFKTESGNPLGKAPVLKDGDLTITESGAIVEYLIETYDEEQRLLGGEDLQMRNKIRMWIHAAEGTFLIHCLSITYARWFSPQSVKESGDLQKLEDGLAINVQKDLDWISEEIKGHFLVGDQLTAADVMVAFSIQFIFARGLCGGKTAADWPKIEKWLKGCEGTESYRRAVEKTGHKL